MCPTNPYKIPSLYFSLGLLNLLNPWSVIRIYMKNGVDNIFFPQVKTIICSTLIVNIHLIRRPIIRTCLNSNKFFDLEGVRINGCWLNTLITKKFERKNNSDKRVSENLTVRNFRRPKFFQSSSTGENENNVYFALTIWRFFTTKSIFFLLFFFIWWNLDLTISTTNNLPNSFIFMRFRVSFPHFLPKFCRFLDITIWDFVRNFVRNCPKFAEKPSEYFASEIFTSELFCN